MASSGTKCHQNIPECSKGPVSKHQVGSADPRIGRYPRAMCHRVLSPSGWYVGPMIHLTCMASFLAVLSPWWGFVDECFAWIIDVFIA
jgi:hypothetical protein